MHARAKNQRSSNDSKLSTAQRSALAAQGGRARMGVDAVHRIKRNLIQSQ